jgi:hypothetical protein
MSRNAPRHFDFKRMKMEPTKAQLKRLARTVTEDMAKFMLRNGEHLPFKDERQTIADTAVEKFVEVHS